MTTKVTVDAHAGWPVLVQHINPDSGEALEGYADATVPANEKRDFYVHSTMALAIYEMPLPAST